MRASSILLSSQSWARRCALDALPAAARPLAEMVGEGFLTVVEGRLIATAAGRPLLDAVTARLLTA
jgi:hypothetical protein